MSHEKAKVEFENDRVKVTRVAHEGRAAHAPVARHDRLIVYLRDGHVARTEGGKREEIRRPAGSVVWRDRSEHGVENLEEGQHEVLVIEIKE
jgi:hypothetical protein